MFILIVIILLGTCLSVLSSIYYNTTALQKTYWSVNSYYWAYYWAVSSIERWLLMSKVKYPTYVWSGWFEWDQIVWARSNGFSWTFWRLNQWNNTMLWTVNSLTQKISWTIDTKTLRAISFKKYDDNYPAEYSTGSQSTYYGINEWLTFSWKAIPGTTLDPITSDNLKVDFNRFFAMRDEHYTVRWLLKQATQNSMWAQEREVTLTWNFFFWATSNPSDPYAANPWPMSTWAFSITQ